MATAALVQRTGFTYTVRRYKPRGANSWLWSGGLARDEARSMVEMMRRTGASIEDTLELIAVPPEQEAELRLYARANPEDASGIERVIQFRKRVAEEFERRVADSRSDRPHCESSSEFADSVPNTPST